jgi:hypothetical protein
MALRELVAARGPRRPTLLLLVAAGLVAGCHKRPPDGRTADTTTPVAAASADAAGPSDVLADAAPPPPPAADAHEPDRAADVAVTPNELPQPPAWTEAPLVVPRDLAALERECARREQQACVALADRLADGPLAERDAARADELYARACEHGRRSDACRRLGLRLLRRASSPAAGRAAELRLEQACAGGFLDACATLGEAKVRGERLPQDVYVGLQRLQRACNAGHAAACAVTRTLRAPADSFDLPLPRAVAPKPVEEGQGPDALAVCPALFHGAAVVAPDERLDGELAPLDPAELAAALPAAPDGWSAAAPATGDDPAVARGTVVGRRWTAGERSVELVLRDRAPDCTLQPGTAAAMLERTGRAAEGRRTAQVRDAPAVLAGPLAARTLTWWVAERCELRLTGAGVPDDELRALAALPDAGALRRVCARRVSVDGRPIYEP